MMARVALATFIGAAESYDFHVYGIVVTLVPRGAPALAEERGSASG
jgi:hypothetical protein